MGTRFQRKCQVSRGAKPLLLRVSNRGEEHPVGGRFPKEGSAILGRGIQGGQRSRLPARSVLQSVCDTLRSPPATRTPWQWFPKATELPWREESNETGRFRGTRLCWQSLVCYTFWDRGWFKGVVLRGNKHFEAAAEQADFASLWDKKPGVCKSKSACSGVGGAVAWRDFCKNLGA